MFRLAKLNFRIAIFTSETLFGLGMQILGGLFGGLMLAQSAEKTFSLSSVCFLPWIAGVFIAFALTIDNDSGCVCNKLIAGFSKPQILVSQVLAAMLLSLVYMLAALIPVVIPCFEIITKNTTVPDMFRALLFLTSGFFITAALAAVISTVIFSRTAAILIFIGLLVLANGVSVKLFEEQIYVNRYNISKEDRDFKLSEREGLMPSPLRNAAKVFVCSSPIVQGYLYDEVTYDRSRHRIEQQKAEIAYYAEYSANHPEDSKADRYDPLRIAQMKDELRVLEEQDRDLDLIPLYSLGAVIIITAAGVLVFRKRNIT